MDLQQKSILLIFLVSLCLVSTAIAQKISQPENNLIIFDPESEKQIVPLDYAPTTEKIKSNSILALPDPSIFNIMKRKFILLPQLLNPCKCHTSSCNCCVDLKFSDSNSSKNGLCVTLTSKKPEIGVDIRVDIKDITILNQVLVLDNVTPACIPLPFLGLPLIGCLRISQIKLQENRDKEFCISLDLKFTIMNIYEYNFSCFRVGSQGIEILPFTKTNKKQPSWFG